MKAHSLKVYTVFTPCTLGETCLLSCKQSSRFESENVDIWSPANSPFETSFLEVKVRYIIYIYIIAVKTEPPFESKQQRNNSY